MANGILRERVFGCDLGERLALVGREVPLVLEMCSAVIEEYGIVDGIYRLSGILSNLQRLRYVSNMDLVGFLAKIRSYFYEKPSFSSEFVVEYRRISRNFDQRDYCSVGNDAPFSRSSFHNKLDKFHRQL